ncbi:hypothetical protein C1I99_26465 [Micromonospora deserti]|uniref:Short-chain dehydrogenase n=1 Tax=Micromonospora deserti TaxID=2070366 RepID=A0A2W2BMP2_9ACTN|nr:hypothetical protein C1I99_26465 [Micromonospora deserti]
MVTGASAGIGRAVVGEFARCGYDVEVLARGEDGLRAALPEVRGLVGPGWRLQEHQWMTAVTYSETARSAWRPSARNPRSVRLAVAGPDEKEKTP